MSYFCVYHHTFVLARSPYLAGAPCLSICFKLELMSPSQTNKTSMFQNFTTTTDGCVNMLVLSDTTDEPYRVLSVDPFLS
jgi:hypothetical protein